MHGGAFIHENVFQLFPSPYFLHLFFSISFQSRFAFRLIKGKERFVCSHLRLLFPAELKESLKHAENIYSNVYVHYIRLQFVGNIMEII